MLLYNIEALNPNSHAGQYCCNVDMIMYSHCTVRNQIAACVQRAKDRSAISAKILLTRIYIDKNANEINEYTQVLKC